MTSHLKISVYAPSLLFSLACGLLWLRPDPAITQVMMPSRWQEKLKDKYNCQLDIVYGHYDDDDVKLDVYFPQQASGLRPALIWFHGGGWSRGSKGDGPGQLMPFLRAGWVGVNANYRLMSQAPAPAAVIDCRCALHWVIRHAKEFGIDARRVVVGGSSAGGHLALMAGMLTSGDSLDRPCADSGQVDVAAILDFYGPTDLVGAIEGSRSHASVVKWIGDRPDKAGMARLVSPMTYVRKSLPPVFIVHGDADPTVPIEQSVNLHKALNLVGVANELHVVPGGKHGKFNKEENEEILRRMVDFLVENGIAGREMFQREDANVNPKGTR